MPFEGIHYGYDQREYSRDRAVMARLSSHVEVCGQLTNLLRLDAGAAERSSRAPLVRFHNLHISLTITDFIIAQLRR